MSPGKWLMRPSINFRAWYFHSQLSPQPKLLHLLLRFLSLVYNNDLLWGWWYDWRREAAEKKLKSMDNEYQSITGDEGGSMWQQRERSWSLASLWLMPCLAVRGDRDSQNALQITVWRLHFPQSPKPCPSSRSVVRWCPPADRGSNATINCVAMVINQRKPWLI